MVAVPAAPAQPAPQTADVNTKMNNLYTKRINDPSLIPALLAAGIQFGAVKVVSCPIHSESSLFRYSLLAEGSRQGKFLAVSSHNPAH